MNEYLYSESQASGSFVYKFLNRDAACAAIESGAGAGVNWRQYWRQNSAFWRQNSARHRPCITGRLREPETRFGGSW
jgi:hypothetical protein